MTYILAIDQGTTSTGAIVYDDTMTSIASAQEEFPQHFPQSGWVEHDPDDLWRTTQATCRGAIDKAEIKAGDIAAIGITNQRETVVVWDKATGRPIYNAIVWQDRRTASQCRTLRDAGHEEPRRCTFGAFFVSVRCLASGRKHLLAHARPVNLPSYNFRMASLAGGVPVPPSGWERGVPHRVENAQSSDSGQ